MNFEEGNGYAARVLNAARPSHCIGVGGTYKVSSLIRADKTRFVDCLLTQVGEEILFCKPSL